MPSAQLCLQIMFIQAKLHLFQLAGHFTSFSVWWLTTSNVWVWACACASCCVLVVVSGFLHPRKKNNLSQKRQNVSNMESEATSGLFLSLFLLRTWQLSTLKDRRANNYLSQVAGVIVGGWKMSDEDRVCLCVCVSKNGVSFWPRSAADTLRDRFCVPRQEVCCFHLSRLSQLHPSTHFSRDKEDQSRMSDWDQAREPLH